MHAKKLKTWVNKMVSLCQPDQVVWCDGSDAENKRFLTELVATGKALALHPEKRPRCHAFFSDPSDVARVEDRTFIASKKESDAGPTNNWQPPRKLTKTMTALFKGSMKGRTMYVIPFIMGPIDSPLSKIGIQLTDSLYVVVNMRIMTRMGDQALAKLAEKKTFIPCLHSIGHPLSPGEPDPLWPAAPIERKYIAHFPEKRLIWSYGSGYGGNALLGKKCLALRIASKMAKDEGWMAEHMLILKITNPEGRHQFFAAAFPSACGKTNLAMLVSKLPGWKVETIGDDIAWITLNQEGRMVAINPEKGFFGVAKGTSHASNPSAMNAIETDTIFTNVAITDDQDVWWEGIDGETPSHLMDWKREDWTPDKGTPAAHPNSRFTTTITNCPVIAPEWDDPEGVPISAILVGGRRPSTIPLVHESFDWTHGVFMGSMMGSEITAATISTMLGIVRRDPFAMLPFIGYHVGDYLAHWLEMGEKTEPSKLPKIYYVNWFRKDEQDGFLWPGFGHNIRVLKWIFERIDGTAEAKETPIGYLPTRNAIDRSGLKIKNADLDALLNVDPAEWQVELRSINRFYESIGTKLPDALTALLKQIQAKFENVHQDNQGERP